MNSVFEVGELFLFYVSAGWLLSATCWFKGCVLYSVRVYRTDGWAPLARGAVLQQELQQGMQQLPAGRPKSSPSAPVLHSFLSSTVPLKPEGSRESDHLPFENFSLGYFYSAASATDGVSYQRWRNRAVELLNYYTALFRRCTNESVRFIRVSVESGDLKLASESAGQSSAASRRSWHSGTKALAW